MALKVATVARNAELDALAALANGGVLRIYSGSQPANPQASIGGATLLAELTMNATAFGAASSGQITANAITADTTADATGTAAWFRLLKSDGSTAILDGSVGAGGSGATMEINSTAIQANAAVEVTSFTISLPES